MKKKLIFKCEGANRGLVHVVKFMPETLEPYYKVMRSRHNVGLTPVYSDMTAAIAYAVSLSVEDITQKINKSEL